MPLPELYDITVEMKAETQKAILYNDGTQDFWVPKSMISDETIQVEQNATGTLTLTAPTWWLKQRKLI